ncbi:hypothetical protein [Aeromicrobium duanguangcaii]|uniref:Uncharacterized protein n=1 Tax=Aeromicrobium duanguangcaii TaxID=2968086 RepID=A0ABY5KFE5_9ACTN|nr:hypothetical protein [Aeromicrobium duanguangcaii]MCD9153738.1 hypothetical protein [Aeromicrobium duanguangcaii]UUI69184.1 hypothetical protein NP095_03490 [Aeromicrobium duanguangcaii]
MTETPIWPFYATCALIVLAGVFMITSTDSQPAGRVLVVFGVVSIVGSLVRTAVDRFRGRDH